MEENNRKGPGIFYAVTGIATLVVAIVGATFAFFAASAENNNITGNTAKAAGITLTVDSITKSGSNMIPVNFKANEGKDAEGEFVDVTKQFDKAMSGKCKDINGNNVCDVYKIVITNNSETSTIDVRGTLTITEGPANMKWQLLEVTNDALATFAASEVTNHAVDAATVTDLGATGQLVRLNTNGAQGSTEDNARRTLGVTTDDNSETYYVVIWLEEKGIDQGTADADKTFNGKVTFDAVDAAGNQSGITASFAA